MRYITVPEDIILGKDNAGNDVKHSFFAWLVSTPLNGEQFGKSGDTLRMSLRLEKRFDGKTCGDEVPLEDKEWEMLLDSSENPKGGYITPAAKLFVPFMDAVKNARHEGEDKAEDN